MRIEELIGQRIRGHRERLGLTQEQLGQRLGDTLGRAWSRQAISAAEKGDRAFTAAELLAIAHTLGVSVGALLVPQAGVEQIELPNGTSLSHDDLVSAVLPRLGTERAIERMQSTLQRLAQTFEGIRMGVELAVSDVELLNDAVYLAQGVGELSGRIPADQIVAGDEDEPQPVVAAVVTSELGVLAGKRHDGKPPWTFIAGEVEPGERPEDAAIREVKEETGLRVVIGQLIGERKHPKTGRQMIYMAVTPTRGTDVFVGDEEELAEVRWLSLAEADELLPGMFEPVRAYLERELGGTEQ